MEELDWIRNIAAPETTSDVIELLKIFDEFDTFPNNFVNAKHKRIDILKNQITKIKALNINIHKNGYFVEDVTNEWLHKLNYLICLGEKQTHQNLWHQDIIKRYIKKMKKDMVRYFRELPNNTSYWEDF